jgi:DNA-binding XRE family transcriptional regulator
LDLLEEHGNQLGMPHAKAMGGGLIELKVRGKQEVRVFYAFTVGKRIYLLHGFIKKTQTTPKKHLDIARQRQAELAQKAGVSRVVVARLETGTTNPTIETVNRVAGALGKELKLVGSN